MIRAVIPTHLLCTHNFDLRFKTDGSFSPNLWQMILLILRGV